MNKARLLLEIEYDEEGFGKPTVNTEGIKRALFLRPEESVRVIYLHYSNQHIEVDDVMKEEDPKSDSIEMLMPPNCCGVSTDLTYNAIADQRPEWVEAPAKKSYKVGDRHD